MASTSVRVTWSLVIPSSPYVSLHTMNRFVFIASGEEMQPVVAFVRREDRLWEAGTNQWAVWTGAQATDA